MTTVIRDVRYRQASAGSLKNGCKSDSAKLTTTDATATAIYSIPMALNTAIAGRALVVGHLSDYSASISVSVTAFSGRRGASGNVAEAAAETVVAMEDSSGTPAVTVAANTSAQTIEIKVAGIAAETWLWEIHVEYLDS